MSAARLRKIADDWSATATLHHEAAQAADTPEQRAVHESGVRICDRLAKEFADLYRTALRDEAKAS